MFIIKNITRVCNKNRSLLNVSLTVNRKIAFGNEEKCPVIELNINSSHCPSEEWKNAKPFESIPGPKPIPILGNTLRFMRGIGEYGNAKENSTGIFESMYAKYGEIVRLEKITGLDRALYLYNPVDIEMVYRLEGVLPEKDFMPSLSYYRANMRQDIFKNAKGLINSNGNDWHNFRSKVNSIMMQPAIVKKYIDPVNDIARQLMERIKSISGNDNKITTDFQKELNKWSLESIAYLALNKRLGCLHGDLSEDSIPAQMIRIVEEVFIYSGKLDFEPSIWKYISTPTFKKAMKVYDEQTTMCENLIKQAFDEINQKKNNNDVNEQLEKSVLEKLLKIDERFAVVMSLDMLLAGVDTTSTAVTNILYNLAINPSKQEILQNEILNFLPNKESVLTVDTLNLLKYLKACTKEAARLYPIVPGILRNLTKDAVLSGYRVPKGTKIFFVHIHASNNEKYFPRPNEFIPERWLRNNINSDILYTKTHPFCTMPFGFGSRSCVGRRFAELETEIAIINFMRHFKVSWNGPPPKKISTIINLLKGPYNFVFENINS